LRQRHAARVDAPAEIASGPAAHRVPVADITALHLDAIVDAANSSLAAAGSTAQSTAPPVRTSTRLFATEHWKPLRTSNVFENSFATIRHWTMR
jgi:hypothetical protein